MSEDLLSRLEHYAKRAMPGYPADICSEAKREIERLQAAKRNALQIADERAKEAVGLRSQLASVTKDLTEQAQAAQFEAFRLKLELATRDEAPDLREQLASANEACLALCGNHGFATGHGDTIADMIGEIDGQIRRLTLTDDRGNT